MMDMSARCSQEDEACRCTFHNRVLLEGLATPNIDQHTVWAHGLDSLCIHQVVRALCVGQCHHHIVAVCHEIVQLVRGVDLQQPCMLT